MNDVPIWTGLGLYFVGGRLVHEHALILLYNMNAECRCIQYFDFKCLVNSVFFNI